MSKIGAVGHKLYTGETSIDFVGRKRTWYTFSAIILTLSIGALIFRGLNFSIEFEGGATFTATGVSCNEGQARDAVAPLTRQPPVIQLLDGGSGVRVQTEILKPNERAPIQAALGQACGVKAQDVSFSATSATWGGEVTRQAFIALAVFLVLVSIFIRIMFETRMAVAAMVALLHDVVITVGLYALIGFSVSPATVIGLLTILGYSLYDTIVVFDTLRDNVKTMDKRQDKTYDEIANLSVNQILIRSINTSVIALLPIGSILFVGSVLLGAGPLEDLSLVLLIGIAVGTFSSIFIATPVLADLKSREPAVQARNQKVLTARGRDGAARTASMGSAGVEPVATSGTTALLDRPDGADEGDGLDQRSVSDKPRPAGRGTGGSASRAKPGRGGRNPGRRRR